MRQLFGRDGLALVADPQGEYPIEYQCRDVNGPVGAAMGDGIGQQVGEQLGQAAAVTADALKWPYV